MQYKPLSSVRYLIVHCAATPPSMDIDAATIDRWHRQQGWLQIGYHFVIRRDGGVEEGRPIDMPGAHARGYNHLSLGICLVGGVSEEDKTKSENNFTEDQFYALHKLLLELKEKFPEAEVIGHRDVNSHKDCPSFNVKEWWKKVNK